MTRHSDFLGPPEPFWRLAGGSPQLSADGRSRPFFSVKDPWEGGSGKRSRSLLKQNARWPCESYCVWTHKPSQAYVHQVPHSSSIRVHPPVVQFP